MTERNEEKSIVFHINAPVQAVIGQVKNSNSPFSSPSSSSTDQVHEEVEPEGTEPKDATAEDNASLTDYNVEADPSSDLTDDYHLLRNLDYSFELMDDNDDGSSEQEQLDTANVSGNASIDNTFEMNQYHQDSWKVKEVDVLFQLKKIREKSLKLKPKTLSDLRLLSISDIYLFSLDKSESVIEYIDFYSTDDLDSSDEEEYIRKKINEDLDIQGALVEINANIIAWSHALSKINVATTNWFDIQETTLPFLNDARANNNKIEMIAANTLHRLALNFCYGAPDVKLEDSFVHNIVSVVFESVFHSDLLLSHQWANGCLAGTKRKVASSLGTLFKPDFVVFMQHRQDRYGLAVSEIKSPCNANSNNVIESDRVKMGREMKWMLNDLLKKGVHDPVVGGILLEGYKMKTYKMDLRYPQVYRMIQLSSVTLFDHLQGASMFPSILSNILQIKGIIRKTAIRAKKRALAKSDGEPRTFSPPLSYMSTRHCVLQRVNNSKKQKKDTD
ncbi:hypothetical protein BDC45DRAFT_562282 [Circinella umbellata]|nr:hypothetical protein BDC45DRAFT_562282 [Circinella umbellata]